MKIIRYDNFFVDQQYSISLPSGGESYGPEDIEWPDEGKELPVYPMTAIDEITTKTPDALFNGSAMVLKSLRVVFLQLKILGHC